MQKHDQLMKYLEQHNLVDEYGFVLDGVTVGDIVGCIVASNKYIVTSAYSGLIVDESTAREGLEVSKETDDDTAFGYLRGFRESADFGRIPDNPEKPWGAEHGDEPLDWEPIEAIYGNDDEPYYIVWEEV